MTITPNFHIDLIVDDDQWAKEDFTTVIKEAVWQTLNNLSFGHKVELSIMLCNDSKVRRLNSDFRGQDKPTNVLSFPQLELKELEILKNKPYINEKFPIMLGDIAIAYETTLNEAKEQQKPFKNHVIHLCIHGLLHLLGYDHIEDDEAEEMEGLEVKILNEFKIKNPYAR